MIIIYVLMYGIIYFKQSKITNYEESELVAFLVALIWFISVPVYIIRAVFINDWRKQ